MAPNDLLTHRCKLCLKETSEVGPLKQSHIIPKFMLRRSKGTDGKAVIFRDGQGRASLSQFDWHEPMLCQGCEAIMQAHENLLNEVLFLRRRKPAIFDEPDRLVLSVESDHFAVALLTIFWRAVVSERSEFRRVFLPPYLTEGWRNAIYTGQVKGWNTHVTIKVEQLLGPNGKPADLLVTPFVREPIPERPIDFVFVCAGFCFTFSLPVLRETIYMGTSVIRPGARVVRIKKIASNSVPEVDSLIKKMLAAGREITRSGRNRTFAAGSISDRG